MTVALGNHEALDFPVSPGLHFKRKYEQLKTEQSVAHQAMLDKLDELLPAMDSTFDPDVALKGAQERVFAEEQLRNALKPALGEITCPYCLCALPLEEVFNKQTWHEEYMEHMRDVHNTKLSDAKLRALANRNARSMPKLFPSCPLCGKDESEFGGRLTDHITGHLRSLALRSLPSYEEDVPDYVESEKESSTTSDPNLETENDEYADNMSDAISHEPRAPDHIFPLNSDDIDLFLSTANEEISNNSMAQRLDDLLDEDYLYSLFEKQTNEERQKYHEILQMQKESVKRMIQIVDAIFQKLTEVHEELGIDNHEPCAAVKTTSDPNLETENNEYTDNMSDAMSHEPRAPDHILPLTAKELKALSLQTSQHKRATMDEPEERFEDVNQILEREGHLQNIRNTGEAISLSPSISISMASTVNIPNKNRDTRGDLQIKDADHIARDEKRQKELAPPENSDEAAVPSGEAMISKNPQCWECLHRDTPCDGKIPLCDNCSVSELLPRWASAIKSYPYSPSVDADGIVVARRSFMADKPKTGRTAHSAFTLPAYEDKTENITPMGSIRDSANSWTMVDVPPGTEAGADTQGQWQHNK
ncbi:hypothetical protein ACHAQJ_003385 [Trichoderma viride]